jgi:hypothetical protein
LFACPILLGGQRLTAKAKEGNILFRHYLMNDSLTVAQSSSKLVVVTKQNDIIIKNSSNDSINVHAEIELTSLTGNIAEKYANRYWQLEYVQRKNSDLLCIYFDVHKVKRKFFGGGFIVIGDIDENYYKTINSKAFIGTPRRKVTTVVFVPKGLEVCIYAKSGNVTVCNDSKNNVYPHKYGKDVEIKNP